MDTDSLSNKVIPKRWKIDFFLVFGNEMSYKFASTWANVLMLKIRSEVYHINARPVSVDGKNLYNNAGLVVYSSIKFLYANICSSGHAVPSKATMFGT